MNCNDVSIPKVLLCVPTKMFGGGNVTMIQWFNSVDNVCVFLWPRARVVSAIACSEEQKMVGREIEWIYEIPQ